MFVLKMSMIAHWIWKISCIIKLQIAKKLFIKWGSVVLSACGAVLVNGLEYDGKS